MRFAGFSDFELCLIWVVDELESDELEEIAYLISNFFHAVIVD